MNILRKIFKPAAFFSVILGLSKYRFYRKWWGGHWELWYVDFPVCAEVWHDVAQCSLETKKRPFGLLRGTPECEHYNIESKLVRDGRDWEKANLEGEIIKVAKINQEGLIFYTDNLRHPLAENAEIIEISTSAFNSIPATMQGYELSAP